MKQPRIKRTYLIAPLVNALILAGSKRIGRSQAAFIEYCVLDKFHEIIWTQEMLKKLADADEIGTIQAARSNLLKEWGIELPPKA